MSATNFMSTQPRHRHSIPLIGLVGGIASGKSTVAKILEEQGGILLNADATVHRLMESSDIQHSLCQLFGPSALKQDGSVDRNWIAQQVFGTSEKAIEAKKRLEDLLHPRVRVETEQRLAQIRQEGKARMVILDAPLLLEAGYRSMCDAVVFIETPEYLRQKWATLRGWTVEQWRLREESQWPLARKAAESDFILQNTGNLHDLREQVESLLAALFSS